MAEGENPFTPGFGVSPAILVGRSTAIDEFEQGLTGELPGQRHVLVSGARGTGKTVLLTEFEAVAVETGWHVMTLHTATESLVAELRAEVIENLRQMDPDAEQYWLTSARVSGIDASRERISRYDNETPPLSRMLGRLAELITNSGGGLLITLDELQSADPSQVHEVTQHVQDQTRSGAAIAFVAAGVQSGVDELLAHEKTTFLRRAHRVELSGVTAGTAAEAIRQTIAETHKSITPEAAVKAGEISQGYPYLIQLIGARAWTRAGDAKTIEIEDVEQVQDLVISEMIKNVHRPALRGLSARKRDYLSAMLQNQSPARVRDIAKQLGKPHSYQAVYRDRLINDGLIRPSGLGHVEFALPYLREALTDFQPVNEHTGGDEITRSRARQRRYP